MYSNATLNSSARLRRFRTVLGLIFPLLTIGMVQAGTASDPSAPVEIRHLAVSPLSSSGFEWIASEGWIASIPGARLGSVCMPIRGTDAQLVAEVGALGDVSDNRLRLETCDGHVLQQLTLHEGHNVVSLEGLATQYVRVWWETDGLGARLSKWSVQETLPAEVPNPDKTAQTLARAALDGSC